jgi:hypothetical protein
VARRNPDLGAKFILAAPHDKFEAEAVVLMTLSSHRNRRGLQRV